jgi:hypothetical protein
VWGRRHAQTTHLRLGCTKRWTNSKFGLIFWITCEHLSVGNPLHLSNWRMRYSRMTWILLFHCKVLGIYFTNQKIQIACSLNDIQIPTKAIYDCSWQKPSTYASYFCVESCQNLWPLLRVISCSKIKTHVHAINNQLFLHWGYTTTCISIHKINTPCFKNTIFIAYFQKKRHQGYAGKNKKNGTHEGPEV